MNENHAIYNNNIQGRRHEMPSSRARSTRGQENEAWAQYKKNPSRETRATFLGTDTSFAQSHPPLLEKIPDRRQLFFLANHNSPEQTPHTRLNLNVVVVGALRPITTNCRVSFIDLYLVFSRNFRIVFLPHTNTVIITPRGTPPMKVVGMHIVSLMGVNFGFWSH